MNDHNNKLVVVEDTGMGAGGVFTNSKFTPVNVFIIFALGLFTLHVRPRTYAYDRINQSRPISNIAGG